MLKVVILTIALVTINAVDLNIDKFLGQWTLIALHTEFGDTAPECRELSFSRKNVKCTCADGKSVEIIKMAKVTNGSIDESSFDFPMLGVEDVKDVKPSLNVSCTCGEKEFMDRIVLRLLGDNYLVTYRHFQFAGKPVNNSAILAKNIPSRLKLSDLLKHIDDDRTFGVLCTSESSDRP